MPDSAISVTATPTVAPTATAVPLPTDPLALTRSTRVITAAYDGLQRLIAAREQPGTFFRYDYDLAGNRTGVWQDGAQTAALTYNAADQVESWQYDAAGNLLSDGSHQWTYDALGRMTGVQMSGEQGSYTYNGDGVLVRAQGSWGQNERYAVDLAAPLSQVLQVQYPMGSTTALYGQGRLGLQENGATTWLLSDALGSVRQTADSGGTPGWGVWYDPWGQVEQGAVPTFGFAGEQQDTFTGQVYLRARWYAPQQGRFLSWRWAEDESNDLIPYSHHAYAYAHSNPFNWTDPTGKCIPYIQEGCRFREIHKPECIASWVPVVGQADCDSLLNVNDFSEYWHGPAGAAALALLGILVPPVGVASGVYFFYQSAQAWERDKTPENFGWMALDGALLICSLGAGGGIRPSAQGALALVGTDARMAQAARAGFSGRTLGQALLAEDLSQKPGLPKVVNPHPPSYDPLARYGPARTTHPEEYEQALRELENAGVDIDFRSGSMAYSPRRGGPGRMIFDKDGSIGALRHEMQHFRDDVAAGHPGIGPFMENPQLLKEFERRGYQQEIDYAMSIGDTETAQRLHNLMIERFRQITERYGE